MPIHDAWVLEEAPSDDGTLPLSHPALRSILIRRGVATLESFRLFANPTREDLHDPAGIHGMAHATERIERAIRDREPIVIYGDYDADGVTSIVLLRTVLRTLGADVDFVVPQRLVDGYGLKMEVLERVLAERQVRLVITVDCGITSVDPVRHAIDRGIDVIITDHHLPPGLLPAAAAVLNPKQPGCEYPYKELAGVGVAFKLCCELIRRSGRKISVDSLMKIAAIGTIADVAPLTGENRAIVRLGLDGLQDVRNHGLRALLRRIGIYGRRVRSSDVGFKIGPRINAAGRLASANTAIDLFAASNEESAWQLGAELDRMNSERQAIEEQVRRAAAAQVAPDDRIIIAAGEGWHRGVVGLTAGRLMQKHHRPALVIAIDGGTAVGSGRSIAGINLHEHLQSVEDLFTHFGGHELACGFSLPASNLAQLRSRLRARFDGLDPSLFVRRAVVDAELALAEIDADFVAEHDILEPFGSGNPAPLFLSRNVSVRSSRTFADDCWDLTVEQAGATASVTAWPQALLLVEQLRSQARHDILFRVEPDAYARTGARLSLVDARAVPG